MMFERQNESQALMYLRASVYCERKERGAKFLAIFFALALCAGGITNSCLPSDMSIDSRWFLFGTGFVLLLNEFLLFKARRYRAEGASINDMYDDYVYGVMDNKVMTYPMNQIVVENYARKVKNKKNKYNNYYFESRVVAEKRNAIFENQYKFFCGKLKLLIFARSFMYVIWSIFFVALAVACAVVSIINDAQFLEVLSDIVIPSFSIIFLIVQAWQTMHYDTKYYANAVDRFNKIRKDVQDGDSRINLNGGLYLRLLQDAVFQARSSGNTFPLWLEKWFSITEMLNEKKRLKETDGIKNQDFYLLKTKKEISREKAAAKKKSTARKSVVKKSSTPKTKTTKPTKPVKPAVTSKTKVEAPKTPVTPTKPPVKK